MAVVARATAGKEPQQHPGSDEKYSWDPTRGAPQKARYIGTEEGDDIFQSLRDERPWFRAKALHELGKMGEWGAETMGNADQAFYMLEDPSAQVQAAALLALGQMGSYGAAYGDFLAQRTHQGSADREVRRAALRALGSLGEHARAHLSDVEACLEDDNPDVVATACVAFGALRGPAPRLVERLRAGDIEVVVAACKGLGLLAAGAEGLVELLNHQEPRVRAAAVAALGKEPFGAMKHLGSVVPLVGDSDAQVRIAAANLVIAVGDRAAMHAKALGDLLEARHPGIKAAAATALGGLGIAAASEVPRLMDLLSVREEDRSTLVQQVAGQAPKVPPTFRKPACAAAAALAVIGDAAHQAAAQIADGLDSFDEEVRIQCACALTGLGDAGARHEDRVLTLLDDPLPMVVASACYALGSMAETTKAPSTVVAERVAGCLKSAHPAVRGAAVQGLGKMGEEAGARIESIVKCFNDKIGYVRAQALGAIASLAQSQEIGQMIAPEVCRLMFDQEVRVRIAAVKALPKLGYRGATFADEVACLMDDPWPEVRAAGLRALGDFGAAALESGGHMHTILQVADCDQAAEVRQAAHDAARALGAYSVGKAYSADSDAEVARVVLPEGAARPLEGILEGQETKEDEELAANASSLLGITLEEALEMSHEELLEQLHQHSSADGQRALEAAPLQPDTEE